MNNLVYLPYTFSIVIRKIIIDQVSYCFWNNNTLSYEKLSYEDEVMNLFFKTTKQLPWFDPTNMSDEQIIKKIKLLLTFI